MPLSPTFMQQASDSNLYVDLVLTAAEFARCSSKKATWVKDYRTFLNVKTQTSWIWLVALILTSLLTDQMSEILHNLLEKYFWIEPVGQDKKLKLQNFQTAVVRQTWLQRVGSFVLSVE